MIVELDELRQLLEKIYPPSNDVFTKLVLYTDGSGHVDYGDTPVFTFLSTSELVDKLNGVKPQPDF